MRALKHNWNVKKKNTSVPFQVIQNFMQSSIAIWFCWRMALKGPLVKTNGYSTPRGLRVKHSGYDNFTLPDTRLTLICLSPELNLYLGHDSNKQVKSIPWVRVHPMSASLLFQYADSLDSTDRLCSKCTLGEYIFCRNAQHLMQIESLSLG